MGAPRVAFERVDVEFAVDRRAYQPHDTVRVWLDPLLSQNCTPVRVKFDKIRFEPYRCRLLFAALEHQVARLDRCTGRKLTCKTRQRAERVNRDLKVGEAKLIFELVSETALIARRFVIDDLDFANGAGVAGAIQFKAVDTPFQRDSERLARRPALVDCEAQREFRLELRRRFAPAVASSRFVLDRFLDHLPDASPLNVEEGRIARLAM